MIVIRFAMMRGMLALLLAVSFSAAFADDTALFWSLSRDGEPAGYLLGTVHSEDPRVLDFSDDFVGRLTSNDFFAMEMVPDLPTLARLTEYMRYSDGTRLVDVIGPERYERLAGLLAAYGMDATWIEHMKVWSAMMTLSTPPPKSGLFMDFSLSLRAAGAGMKVVGLETLEQQLSFLERMPEDQLLELLDQALAEHDQVEAVHQALVDGYLENDLVALVALSDEQMGGLTPGARDYFVSEGIVARNLRMAESLLPLFENGRVFVAVGSLHLPGESGLINQLREAGFTVGPLPLPFSAAE